MKCISFLVSTPFIFDHSKVTKCELSSLVISYFSVEEPGSLPPRSPPTPLTNEDVVNNDDDDDTVVEVSDEEDTDQPPPSTEGKLK